jgi:hypothetical protein
MPVLDRGRRAVRHHGARGALAQAVRRAGSRVSVNETHVWYALDLRTDYPKAPLAVDHVRRRGGEADLHLLNQLEMVSPEEGRQRIEAGNYLNLVLDGDRLVHCSFTFTHSMPMIAAASGALTLPADTVCIEDGVTAPDLRGTGVGPENLRFVTDVLAAEGIRWVIFKIAVENRSSRRLAEKGGFEEVAIMHFKRLGPHSRLWIEPVQGASLHDLGTQLAAGLQGGERQRTSRLGPAPVSPVSS